MNPTPRASSRPSSNKALIILLVVGGIGACGLFTMLATIAAPALKKYRYQSKQAEAKYTLKALLTTEEWFREQQGYWATNPRALVEYANSAPRTYTCFLSPTGAWGGKGEVRFDQLPPQLRARLQGNEAAVEAQKKDAKVNAELVIVCAANLDEDETLDVWSLSSSDPTPRLELDDSTR